MAYSTYTTTGDGTTVTFPINFTLGFNSRSEVKCRVGNEVDGLGAPVYRTLTWINDGLVTVGGAVVANGVSIRFTRTVVKDELIHDYAQGEAMEEKNFDESNKQNLFAIHEILDGRLESPLANDLDVGGFKVINLGTPTNNQDAAPKSYVDSLVGGTQAYAAAAAASAASALSDRILAGTYASTASGASASASSSASAAASSAASMAGVWRNQFRNGSFDIWQRGTSFTIVAAAAPVYTADGWMVDCTGANITTSRVGPSLGATWMLSLVKANGATNVKVRQRIESAIAAFLQGKTVTVRWTVYNVGTLTFTPKITINRANAQNDFSAVTAEVSAVNLQACPTGYTTVSYTTTLSTNSNGFEFILDLQGALNGSTAGTGNVYVGDADVRIASSVQSVEYRPYHVELDFCRRYLYSSFPPGTTPAQNAGQAGQLETLQGYGASTGNQSSISFRYPVQMLRAPTVTTYSPSSASAQPWNISRAAQCSALAANASSADCFSFTYTTSAGSFAGDLNALHILASAEL